jgi:hypothetical protein
MRRSPFHLFDLVGKVEEHNHSYHEASVSKHASKDGILVNCPVLDAPCAAPNDLLLLLKAAIEKIDLFAMMKEG